MKPHQTRAYNNIIRCGQDRCLYISACGTGKTLVGKTVMDTAFLLGEGISVFFAPSLSLLAQTRRSYLEYGIDDDTVFLFVCSDDEVSKDSSILEDQSISTTDKEVIQSFIKANEDKKIIVFCTYYSSKVLAMALRDTHAIPQLTIYDEAHRTASMEEGAYSYTLSDKNYTTKNRLFMTATPRYSRTEDDDEASYSMENEEVYGPVVEEYSLRQAIEDGVISPYKVIISVMTEKSFLHHGGVHTEDKKRDLKVYALSLAMKEYNIRRTLLFTGRVKKSKEYIERLSKVMPLQEGIHLDSSHTTAYVSNMLKELGDEKGGVSVISSAGILGEGTDVPAVEMVGFMDKTESSTGIIQKIGRSLRLDPKNQNKIGYVFLPLIIPGTGATAEEMMEVTREDQFDEGILGISTESGSIEGQIIAAARREGFKEIVKVVNTLSQNDSSFRGAINKKSIYKPGGGGLVDILLPDDFEGDFEEFKNSITIEAIKHVRSSWDINCEAFFAFIDEKGRAPTKKDVFIGTDLCSWATTQRTFKQAGELSETRIEILNGLGFPWGPQEDRWNYSFHLYQKFVKLHKRPAKAKESFGGSNIGAWMLIQK